MLRELEKSRKKKAVFFDPKKRSGLLLKNSPLGQLQVENSQKGRRRKGFVNLHMRRRA